MAYTPINWQTGDTITADKLNRCDNGWEVDSTQLFSETVTTADQDGIIMGMLAYGSQIDAPTLTVTFDGTDYTCDATDVDGSYAYGGIGEEGPDFTDYPFAILSDVSVGGANFTYTETAGAHAVSAVTSSVMTSSDFGAAVNAVVGTSAMPMRCVPDVTTAEEMRGAADGGRMLYFYYGGSMHVISRFSEVESATAVNAIPEAVPGVETYGFEDVDGTLVFHVTIY